VKNPRPVVCVVIAALLFASSSGLAQQGANIAPVPPVKTGAVPSLVNYSGVLKDGSGRAVSSVTGVTFLIYKDQQGGAPLWLETQSVTPDKLGHYSAQLGSTTSAGLPSKLFLNGEARWLGVQTAGEAEQPRVLLVAVPYAMKAADAETIGGLPPSAFVLAAPFAGNPGANPTSDASLASASTPTPAASNVTTTGGTVNAIPLFSTATNIQNSILTQTAATAVNVVGKLNLPANGTATATAGKPSRPEDFVASVFNSGTSTAVPQTFQLQAEPVNNNTATASGTLNLLYASGASAPAETGLKISNKGLLTFAAGQTFPGTGKITGISTAAGSGLSGGGTTGTLNLALLSTCSANQILKWSGSAWACSSGGAGSVTSVALAAPASDFVVTGSPVTTTGTLNLAWNVPPDINSTANAIVKRDSSGNIVGNNLLGSGVSVSNSSPSATTIFGRATSGTGAAWGVEGYSLSSDPAGYGVFGYAGSATGDPKGVYGQAVGAFGVGVFGQLGNISSDGSGFTGSTGAGVWGDGGSGSGGFAVLGTVDDGNAGYFQNNSPSGYATLQVAAFSTPSTPFQVDATGGSCAIDDLGTLSCTGSKNAIVPVDGGNRTVAMSAIESPQNWFEDFGEAEMVNGSAVVQLDSTYTQTVNPETKYQVFLTPYGDCKGLYVTRRTASSFEVRELGEGRSSLSFGYRIAALRRNYENVRFADHTLEMKRMTKARERMKARFAQPRPAVEVRKSPLAAVGESRSVLEQRKR